MPRLLFEKTGNAVWISHLDLMRLFQRAFKRAGLSLTHTQGFNPRPSVSIALPLSVGVESCCELLDFDLDGDPVPCKDVMDRLNSVLVSGIRVLDVYDTGRKLKELSLLRCRVFMEYDSGVPERGVQRLQALFSGGSLIVPKRTKNGMQDQDIIPMIRTVNISQPDGNTVLLDCVVCCQNPALNPMQLPLAVEMHLPEMKADFAGCCRAELYDDKNNIFR